MQAPSLPRLKLPRSPAPFVETARTPPSTPLSRLQGETAARLTGILEVLMRMSMLVWPVIVPMSMFGSTVIMRMSTLRNVLRRIESGGKTVFELTYRLAGHDALRKITLVVS